MKKKAATESHKSAKGKFNHTAELPGKSMLGDNKKGVARKPPT